jgi:hypothetical protein
MRLGHRVLELAFVCRMRMRLVTSASKTGISPFLPRSAISKYPFLVGFGLSGALLLHYPLPKIGERHPETFEITQAY